MTPIKKRSIVSFCEWEEGFFKYLKNISGFLSNVENLLKNIYQNQSKDLNYLISLIEDP